MNNISVTLTHFRRLDKLDITIESFLKTNTYPIDEFIIIDDSNQYECANTIQQRYGELATIIINEEQLGQRKSLDRVFTQCRNNLIFHLEDDWEFNVANNYIENSISILQAYPDIHQVWVRHEDDNPHKCVGDIYMYNNIEFRDVHSNFNGTWNGFSWNPGLRRKSDYLNFFPNGFQSFSSEQECAIHLKKYNYSAVKLVNTCCKHIGYENSTQAYNI
jgi:hypothetical protein